MRDNNFQIENPYSKYDERSLKFDDLSVNLRRAIIKTNIEDCKKIHPDGHVKDKLIAKMKKQLEKLSK